MRNCLSLLFCVSILRSMAQWGPPTSIVNNDIRSLGLIGDLDGDGDQDHLVLYGASKVAFLNEGLWQFSDPVPVTVPEPEAWSGRLIDVDGDGLDDLIGGDLGPVWSRNLGNLQFGDPQLIVASSAYQFCDLDGQYGLDLVIYRPNGVMGYYYVHQLPDATFTEPVLIDEVGVGISQGGDEPFLLIDLNGDGIKDLVYSIANSASLRVATGTMQGGFDTPVPYFTDPGSQGSRGLSIFDRNPGNGNIGFRFNLIDPHQSAWFEPTIGLDHTVTYTNLKEGNAIDLNADGAMDLWIRPPGELDARISLNDGTGAFLAPIGVSTATFTHEHVLADMDNDGDLDISIYQADADRISILENTGSGILDIRHIVTEVDVPESWQIELVDLDSDGNLDILSCNDAGIRMLMNDGTGTFEGPIMLHEPSTAGAIYSMVHDDLDQDGDVDILSIGHFFDMVLFRQGPAGQFTQILLSADLLGLQGIEFPRHAQFIDADLDEDLDIVVAQEQFGSTTPPGIDSGLLENLGDGSFAPNVELGEAGLFLAECQVVDLNDDGLLDRIGDINGTIGVYLNNGGSFSEPLLFSGTFGKPILITDLNGDGLLDMIAESDGTLIVWHGTGPLAFAAVQTVAMVNYIKYSDLQDMDGDGLVDLVQLDEQQLVVRRCGTNGLFGQANVVWDFEAAGEPLSTFVRGFVKAGDLTGDELVDLLVVTDIGQVELLTNLSNSGYQLSGRIFHDLNGDQVYQPEEPPLPWVNLQVTPNASSPFTDTNGVHTVYATPGTYSLQPALDEELWTVTSTSPLQATLDGGAPVVTGLDFAVVPAQDISLVTASMVQGNVPCGATTFLSLNIANTGTRIEQGTLTLQLSEYASFQSSVPEPTSVVGNTITWTFEELNIQEVRSFVALVTTPTVGSIGGYWNHVLQVVTVDDAGDVQWTTYATLGGEVTCAYDPNDKQVHPAGYGEAGAIAMDTPYLDYTVRFQNTGTAPAFDVVIMDQLDPDLDPERVELLGFSHTPTQVAITANGSIQFKFQDIMLPDSATDQLGSQGFIHFRIHLREGLPHLTTIPNTAAIYFDLNPPIITNTVHSTLVDCNTWQPELEADGYGVLRAPAGDLYQWFLNGDPIPGAQADSIQITTNGSYTVEVTSTLGCVATTPAIIATDIPETHMELGLMLVPNPLTRHARLIATTPLGPGGQVSLLDLHGRVLWTRATAGGPSLDLDFEGLAPGPYLLRVERVGAAPRVLRALLQ